MTDWLAGAALLLYLVGVGTLTHAAPHAWRHLTTQDPRLTLAHETQPTLLPLLLAIAIVGWPGTLIALALTRTRRSTR
ncbi:MULTISPECIES: hypothetical protein [Streptomyces]|uniref:Uncharacterized protein n=2 Tax=Streptomyces fradiae TaxID=1906 RepID=A0A1Y2NQ77_STRFR|nr:MULTISPECIES: hypothetical protein [Streptomyces]KAF0646576.1 hypothetical protein K701_27900 [Streptomyces fradiae ATCC 10745 = DSM 40063]OSY49207.1 hypothetical protein BG846_05185 [Streptomyces fradiae ATCC 10745 = DSM 40063]